MESYLHSPDAGSPVCSCVEMETALHAYVDGELPVARQAALFAHLATCEGCRHMMDSILRFRRVIRQEHLAVPPAVDDAFFKRLAVHRKRTRRVMGAAGGRPAMLASPRVLAVLVVAVFVTGLLIPVAPVPEPVAAGIVGEEELVDVDEVADRRVEASAVYVFYPGLMIEATREEEPRKTESL